MKSRVIYHGSKVVVLKPIYDYKFYNPDLDYGCGFYCTEDYLAATEWSCKDKLPGIVNTYCINEDDLKILDLTKPQYSILNWMAILIFYRSSFLTKKSIYQRELAFLNKYLVDISKYDVVIGYRADDAYYAFPKEFLNNNITLERLEEIYKLGDLGTQYVLVSRKAFDRLTFIEAKESGLDFLDAYSKHINHAYAYFKEILLEERYAEGTRMRDLLKDDR